MSEAFGALGPNLNTVHQDDSSILLHDRAPISWQGRRARGLAWSEGIAAHQTAGSWKQAARGLACCGLVIEGDARYLHSSVAGLGSIYYMEEGDATYFASRIDPLVRSLPEGRSLSIDWDAWAAIFLLTAPLGDRTPFLEVRRLPPFSTLRHQSGRGSRQLSFDWPWADDSPKRRRGAGGPEAIVDGLRETIRDVEGGPLVCPLSGGWDSRLLLMLAEERPDLRVSAWTLNSTHRGSDETPYARAVATALGVPLTEIGRGRSFWGDREEVALHSDYQTTHHGWFMPLARRLRKGSHTVLDGLAGGIFLKGHFVDRGMLTAGSRRKSLALLWDRLSNAGSASEVLSDRLAGALTATALRSWQREAKALAGHPAQLALTAYRTRTVRGISLAPVSILGAEARMLTPFTDDRVARAALAIPPDRKLDGALYTSILAELNPTVGALPSTNDPDEAPEQPTGNRELKRGALKGYRERLRSCSLRDEIAPRILDGDPAAGLGPALTSSKEAHLVRALALLSMWEERYRDRLREIDPGELL